LATACGESLVASSVLRLPRGRKLPEAPLHAFHMARAELRRPRGARGE
jgi:hypothetical protein